MAKTFPHLFFIASVIGGLSTLFWLPPTVKAADFRLAPMLQEVTLHDEAEVQIEITVTNTTAVQETFNLQVIDFGSLDESGGVAFLGGDRTLETKYSLASWMKPEKQSVTLAPGASETLRLTIENTPSLSPGGHYGAVVFQSGSDSSKLVTNSIAIKQMIASLVFVKKVGGANPSLELQEVKRNKSWFYLDREIEIRFRNPGNVHVVPRGVVKIIDPIGNPRYRGIINEASALVLPESDRLFKLSLNPLGLSVLPGWYSFSVEYRFDGESEMRLWEERFFWWPPLAWLLLGALLLLIAGLSYWHRRKKTSLIVVP